jgi:MFS superfamily sulfate permease-like transporter
VVVQGGLDARYGVAVVGQIVPGLPPLDWTPPDWGILRLLFVPACTMTLVGMVQNLSMAQALAVKRGERIDANAELRGLGIANLVAGVYGGMPVGGGVSRSAVNVAAGAQTQLASIVTALSTILLVLWAAPWLARLPLAVLAASIVLAAWSMIDLAALRQAWAYDRADACAWLGTALGVICLGVDVGIGLGVLFSLATLLFHASQPQPRTAKIRSAEPIPAPRMEHIQRRAVRRPYRHLLKFPAPPDLLQQHFGKRERAVQPLHFRDLLQRLRLHCRHSRSFARFKDRTDAPWRALACSHHTFKSSGGHTVAPSERAVRLSALSPVATTHAVGSGDLPIHCSITSSAVSASGV